MPDFNFNRMVRFRAPGGQIYYGEVAGPDLSTNENLVGSKVCIYQGKNPWDAQFVLSSTEREIEEVLSPTERCPMVYGIGLNYKAHSNESGLALSEHPTVFTKTPNSVAGPYEDIPISDRVPEMDYEGELCVIIGKPCKDVGEEEDPTPYILGYTVGNDLSARYWQRAHRSGGQHGYAKSFDKFAPIGPVLVSTQLIPDPKKLHLKTVVNGEIRQDSLTDDLFFDIPAIIRHLSRSTTLEPGTLIMTGTPGGVAVFMDPPPWLKDGDVVEVEISGIGKIVNKMIEQR